MNNIKGGNYIKAEKAREIALTTDVAFQRVDRAIRNAAKDNLCAIDWYMYDFAEELRDALQKHLKDLGYHCELNCDDSDTLHIMW